MITIRTPPPPPPPPPKKKKDKQVLVVIIAPYISFGDHVVKLKQLARMCQGLQGSRIPKMFLNAYLQHVHLLLVVVCIYIYVSVLCYFMFMFMYVCLELTAKHSCSLRLVA